VADSDRVAWVLAYAAEVSGTAIEGVRALGRSVAGSLPSERIPTTSTLNNDGFPFQLCVSARTATIAVRLLGDPGWAASGPADRLTRSLAICRSLVHRNASVSLGRVIDLTLAYGLSDSEEHVRAFDAGAIWLAASPCGSGLAVYVNVQWSDDQSRWTRSCQWLSAVLRDGPSMREHLETLRRHATPVCLAVEGSTIEDARVKLYVRLVRATSLTSLGIASLGHPALAAFLVDAVGDSRLPGSALNLALGWSLATGDLIDAKVDLCAHCLPRPAEAWLALADRVVGRCGLEVLPLEAGLTRGQLEIALVGLGIDRHGGARFNAYLKAA
jgi:hypothetical protein